MPGKKVRPSFLSLAFQSIGIAERFALAQKFQNPDLIQRKVEVTRAPRMERGFWVTVTWFKPHTRLLGSGVRP